MNHLFTCKVLFSGSTDFCIRKNIEASTIAPKQPSLNEQVKSKNNSKTILNNSLFVLYFKTTKMLNLGLCFILYYLKLSGTDGFWS